MVPYANLPPEQRAKDEIFVTVARAVARATLAALSAASGSTEFPAVTSAPAPVPATTPAPSAPTLGQDAPAPIPPAGDAPNPYGATEPAAPGTPTVPGEVFLYGTSARHAIDAPRPEPEPAPTGAGQFGGAQRAPAPDVAPPAPSGEKGQG